MSSNQSEIFLKTTNRKRKKLTFPWLLCRLFEFEEKEEKKKLQIELTHYLSLDYDHFSFLLKKQKNRLLKCYCIDIKNKTTHQYCIDKDYKEIVEKKTITVGMICFLRASNGV